MSNIQSSTVPKPEKKQTITKSSEMKYDFSWNCSTQFAFAYLFHKIELNFEKSCHYGIKNRINERHDFLCIGDVIKWGVKEILFLGILEDTTTKTYQVLYKNNEEDEVIYEMELMDLYSSQVKVIRNEFSLSKSNIKDKILSQSKKIQAFIAENEVKIHSFISNCKSKDSYNTVQFIFSGDLPSYDESDSNMVDIGKMEGDVEIIDVPLNGIPDIILDQKENVEFIILMGCSAKKYMELIMQINLNFQHLKFLVTDLNVAILKYYGFKNVESAKTIYKAYDDNILYIYVFESSGTSSSARINRKICDISKEAKLYECILRMSKRSKKPVDFFTTTDAIPSKSTSTRKKKTVKCIEAKSTTKEAKSSTVLNFNKDQRFLDFNTYLSSGGTFPAFKCETLELKIDYAVKNLATLAKSSALKRGEKAKEKTNQDIYNDMSTFLLNSKVKESSSILTFLFEKLQLNDSSSSSSGKRKRNNVSGSSLHILESKTNLLAEILNPNKQLKVSGNFFRFNF